MSWDQPVLVPDCMGTQSWILWGTQNSDRLYFGSSCHGTEQVMSRAKAKREVKGDRLLGALAKERINILD